MKTLLEQVDALKKEFDGLQPMLPEYRARLDKKFRLELNYNNNHIEGNTLTYGETELLLIFDKTTGDHEMREYEEMKSHDVALKMIKELAEQPNELLTEKFIRELNQVILVRPFYKDAITHDGQNIKRLIAVGEYKSMPNSVRLQNGEVFHYATPAETPALMYDLVSWYHSATAEKNIHPCNVAAELHYRFVRIHPFDDGNGRISRLLMNYHLQKCGYPPVIIKSADKRNYLFALNKADVGDMDAFRKYIAEQLVQSLQVSIKAAQGEVI